MSDFEADIISSSINHIRASSFSDFAALALPIDNGSRYRWEYANGNINRRYQQMMVKRGRGLPGMALLLGRSLIKENSSIEPGKLKIDCSLMLAEGLQAAAAIPIAAGLSDIGVLMVGSRHPYSYTASSLSYLQECAKELSLLLEASKSKT